jgi:hypothetical protein
MKLNRHIAGWNEPGYMPNPDSVKSFPTWEHAHDYVVEEVGRLADDVDLDEDDAREVDVTLATLAAVRTDDAGYPYAVTHGIDELVYWVAREERVRVSLIDEPFGDELPHWVRSFSTGDECGNCPKSELHEPHCDTASALVTTAAGKEFIVTLSRPVTPEWRLGGILRFFDPSRDALETGLGDLVSSHDVDEITNGSGGLNMYMGVPDWVIDEPTLDLVRDWATREQYYGQEDGA